MGGPLSNTKNIVGYKYFQSSTLKEVLGGSVRLSSLEYFRKLEKKEIGDTHEGTEVIEFDDERNPENTMPKIEVLDDETGEYHPIGELNKVTVTKRFDCLIYSAAAAQDDKSFYSRTDYDRCMEICDLDEFSKQIHAQLIDMRGLKAVAVFIGNVSYGRSTNGDWPTQLTKRPDFKWQNELRLLFLIQSPIPKNPVTEQIKPDNLLGLKSKKKIIGSD